MEINALMTADAHEQGAEMRVKDENGNDTDAYIHLMGVDSPESQRLISRIRRQTIDKMVEKEDIDDQYYVDIDIDELVSLTKGWRGLKSNGEEFEFTPEACRNLYEKSPGLRAQAKAFVYARRNFTSG